MARGWPQHTTLHDIAYACSTTRHGPRRVVVGKGACMLAKLGSARDRQVSR